MDNSSQKNFNIAQQTISDRLKAIEIILKSRKWVPHELNDKLGSISLSYRIVTNNEKWLCLQIS